MKLTEAIAVRVKELLNERGLKPYYLFKMGGMPRSTISDVLNVRKKKVSSDTVYQICSTLGISLAEFYTSYLFEELDD
jgi:predicted transcriptional regulator